MKQSYKFRLIEKFIKFQTDIVKRMIIPYSYENDILFRWRAYILSSILITGLFLGTATVAFLGLLIIKQNAWGLVIVDLTGLFLCYTCLFSRSIRYEIRALITILSFFVIGMAVVLSFGLLSGGPFWMFSVPLLAGVLIGSRAAFIAIVLNTVSFVTLGLLAHNEIVVFTGPIFNAPSDMFAACINFTLLSLITSLSVSALLKGLFHLFDQSKVLTTKLEKEHSQLLVTKRNLEIQVISREKTHAALVESEKYHKELFLNSPIALHLQDFSIVEEKIKFLLKSETITDLRTYLLNNDELVDRLLQSLKIIDANKSAIELYKAEDSFQIITDFPKVLKPEDRNHFVDQIVTFFSGVDWYEDRTSLYDFDGNKLELIIRKIVINRKKNGLSKVLVSLIDVTELNRAYEDKKQLEIQLQQTQKMESIGTLAGGIAHDFNNILVPILGHTEILMDELTDDDPVKDNIKEVFVCAMRAKDLVGQILTFSRQGNQEIKLMKIQPVLDEAIKMIRSLLPSTIEIDDHVDPECGPIKADPTQIHQIIMNLSTNAYHAMEKEGGILTVILKQVNMSHYKAVKLNLKPGLYACLTIKDTGVGIDPAVVDKIFDPFFTTKEKGKGTGLGLSVVHGIVNRMEGDIQIDSRKGKGTEFKVYFPAQKKHFDLGISLTKPVNRSGTERILLVDDELEVISIEEKLLARLGYKITSKTSSIEALELFRSKPDDFDLIITDLVMPKISGDKFAEKIVEIRPDIPIIMMTGFNEDLDHDLIGSTGIRSVLKKPVVSYQLARNIRDILDKVNPEQRLPGN